jgi:hypothetical protein
MNEVYEEQSSELDIPFGKERIKGPTMLSFKAPPTVAKRLMCSFLFAM